MPKAIASKFTVRRVLIALVAVIVGVVLAACTSSSKSPAGSAQQSAQNNASNRQNYIPKNDVEGNNYNARQRIADQPSTILWCSVYPTNPNIKPFTVPIVGKLTSGNKRPYSTSQAEKGSDNSTYSTELPGSDGMYGTSGEYRYGFDPAGNYYDFYNLETFCTTVPTLLQQQTTRIEVTVKGNLAELDKQAEAALKLCRKADPDPSKPCPAAVDILGVQ